MVCLGVNDCHHGISIAAKNVSNPTLHRVTQTSNMGFSLQLLKLEYR